MPSITFAPGVASAPRFIESVVDQLAFDATITSATPTVFTARFGTTVFSVQGTAFAYGIVAGEPGLIGGVINEVAVRNAGALQLTVTDIGISAAAFQTAIARENAGTDTRALETLLLGRDWNYVGNGNADVLLATDMSADGVLLNLRGDDTIFGGGGNDDIFLGDGNDVALGGAGNDQFFGGLGNDAIRGDTRANSGNDRLFGGSGNDTLNGGAGDDTVRGGAGNDVLRDEGGTDVIDGGAGVDTLLLDSRELTSIVFNVLVNLRDGTQGATDLSGDDDDLISVENYTHLGGFNMTVAGSALNNQLTTDAGIDRVSGLAGNDVIITGGRADSLYGGSGKDTLHGGSGNDLLSGGAGNDDLTGAAGRDTFVFAAGGGVDTIADFQVRLDRIDLAPGVVAEAFQTDAGLSLSFGNGTSVILEGVLISVFEQIDFI